MSLGASTACFCFFRFRIRVMDPSLVLGHSSVHKFLRVILIARQKIPRNIEPASLWSSVNILGTRLDKTLDIHRMSVRIDWTAPKLVPTSLAISRRFRLLSHMTRLCSIPTFSSVITSLGHPGPFIIFNALCPAPKFSIPFLHCAIRTWRRLLPKGFHEVSINFLGRHSFLSEILYDCLTSTVSILSVWHTLLLFTAISYCNQKLRNLILSTTKDLQ